MRPYLGLKLISGRFYKDGIEVKPSFGDKEQIALMTDYDSMMNKGTDAEPIFRDDSDLCNPVGWGVDCFCGEHVIFSYTLDMDGRKKTCKCGLTYVCHEDEDSFITIKLKPRKV